MCMSLSLVPHGQTCHGSVYATSAVTTRANNVRPARLTYQVLAINLWEILLGQAVPNHLQLSRCYGSMQRHSALQAHDGVLRSAMTKIISWHLASKPDAGISQACLGLSL